MATAAPVRTLDRRLYWTLVALWAVASWFIGDAVAERMTWRINDLSTVPGAGMVQRDTEGVFYYFANEEQASVIYRPDNQEQPTDSEKQTAISGCLDCKLITGEQMSQTNKFCAAGSARTLPKIEFQVPCKSWAVIDEGPKVMATVIFLTPLILLPLFRMVQQGRADKRRKATAANRPRTA